MCQLPNKAGVHAGKGAALRPTTLWFPQAVDTVKTDSSLSPGKVVCTLTKVKEGLILALPWNAHGSLVDSDVLPSPEATQWYNVPMTHS